MAGPSPHAWVISPHPFFIDEIGRLLEGTSVSLVRVPARLASGPAVLPSEPCSVVILDACLPLPSTEALVAEVLDAAPAARILAISEELSQEVAFPLLRLGVKAIVTYVDARRQLRPAIAAVARGAVWVPREILSTFLDGLLARGPARSLPNGRGLSRREKEVLGTVLENLSNKEIAVRLNISERTVKFHVSNLLSKFSVQRRADLILLSFQAAARPERPPLAYPA